MTCDTVLVRVDIDDDQIRLVVPAFTVSPELLKDRIARLAATYLTASRADGEPVSLGDFALFILGQASQDPREIGADNHSVKV